MLEKLKRFSLIALLYGCASSVAIMPQMPRQAQRIYTTQETFKLRTQNVQWWGFEITQDNLAYMHDTRGYTPICELRLGDNARLRDYQCNGFVDAIFDSQGIYFCNDNRDIRCSRANGILFEKKQLLNVRKTLSEWQTSCWEDILRIYE